MAIDAAEVKSRVGRHNMGCLLRCLGKLFCAGLAWTAVFVILGLVNVFTAQLPALWFLAIFGVVAGLLFLYTWNRRRAGITEEGSYAEFDFRPTGEHRTVASVYAGKYGKKPSAVAFVLSKIIAGAPNLVFEGFGELRGWVDISQEEAEQSAELMNALMEKNPWHSFESLQQYRPVMQQLINSRLVLAREAEGRTELRICREIRPTS